MRTLFGGLLMAIGILIAGVSGLCTLLFVASDLSALAVGGVPFMIGVGLTVAGRALLRSARNQPPGY